MALALRAAQATVKSGRNVHLLHMRFVRPIDVLQPVALLVAEETESRSFSRRRVTAIQGVKEVSVMMAEFIRPDPHGRSFQIPLPTVTPPNDLAAEVNWMVETRHVEGDALRRGALADPARQRIWNRIPEPLPDDPALHACALVHMSDATQMWLAMSVNGIDVATRGRTIASLEHSMWFHRAVRADDWILYDQLCPSTSDGTGFVMGQLFAIDGTLVATAAQSGVLRPPT
jgi:acyl-CoA thioesterase-2